MERTSKIIFSLLILLVLNGVVWGIIIFEPKVSKMIFLNVGQGDATLLSFVNSGNILVDAGPNSSILNELGKFLGFFNKKIDVVILSHTNLDHYGGLFDVLNKYQPRVLVYNGFSSKSETFAKLLEDFKNNDSQIVVFKAGDKIKIGLDEVDFIWPPSDSVIKDDNNGSLIFKVLIRNYKILFLGDADFKTIKKIGSDLMADILKISHHGSKTGTDSDLIGLVRPTIALIGVGKDNSYGHPASSILDILKQFQINIFRTDNNGNIQIIFEDLLKVKTDN